ncbi:MAG: TolC family protein [Epsilonproteobacteria bacterium]|nr:TolC family protein [Campylobacterota bacterium]
MKKLFLLSSITIYLSASNELVDVLSDNQSKLIDAQKKQVEVEASKLEKSWINPIRLQYSKSYSTQLDKTTDTGQFVISVDQPIFKMGGIWEAVKYAKALGSANKIDIELKRRALITQALGILFNLKKLNLQIRKLEFLIKNDELDILIQKESYEAGLSNRTLYDRALLKRNQDITSKLELELQITKLKNDFALLSDRDPREISLPNFGMIDKTRYENNQLEVQRDKFKVEEKRHNKYMTWTKYLPEVSVTGRYIDEDKNPLFASADIKTKYYTYGFRVSMPININSFRDIESSKIDYLNAKISLDEQKKKVANEYNLVKKKLEIIDKKIALSVNDADNYASMLSVAQGLEQAGDSTSYDTQIVYNNLKVRELDQDIYKYDAQLELLNLYSKVADAI